MMLAAMTGLLVLGLTACTNRTNGDAEDPTKLTPPASETAVAGTESAPQDPTTDASATSSPIGTQAMPSNETMSPTVERTDRDESADAEDEGEASEIDEESPALPRLIDLGAGKCIPCKKMAPILEELAETKADYFEVTFLDVWENPDIAHEYSVRIIPTQIFYAADEKELYRHIGFYSREQILDKWRELGIDVGE